MKYEYGVVYKINDYMTAFYVGEKDGAACFSSIPEILYFPKEGKDFKIERIKSFDEYLSEFSEVGIRRIHKVGR